MVGKPFVTGKHNWFHITHRHFWGDLVEVGDILGHVQPLCECSSGSSRLLLDPEILINIATSL